MLASSVSCCCSSFDVSIIIIDGSVAREGLQTKPNQTVFDRVPKCLGGKGEQLDIENTEEKDEITLLKRSVSASSLIR